MKMQKYYWEQENVSDEINLMLETLAEDYPLAVEAQGIKLEFVFCETANKVEVNTIDKGFLIRYNSLPGAARGVAHAMAGIEINEQNEFEVFGIMLDCSRNAVMKVEHFKLWLRRLAMMGYNMAMLYTEDTYELPDEPMFGYLRGPYTMDEIKEIDAYAKKLGIEMIACIQVLGHMEQLLKWIDPYRKVADTKETLLIDGDETYKLIEKMIAFWDEALSSKRIHIGMDEAWDFGLGFFLKKNGYHDRFDLFNRHLAKVNEICKKYSLKPMIWSDMYFRMGNEKGLYYDSSSIIPDKIKATVPPEVELVYWDYYQKDVKTYKEMINIHNSFDNKTIMASGIWTWYKLWYDPMISEATIIPCIKACQEKNIKEFFFTIWGNDGDYCQKDSCFAGLCLGAQLSYGASADKAYLEKIFMTITNMSYETILLGAGTEELKEKCCNEEYIGALLWDDPLLGIEINMIKNKIPGSLDIIKRALGDGAKKLAQRKPEAIIVDTELIRQQMEFIAAKINLREKLLESYHKRDSKALLDIADCLLPAMIKQVGKITLGMRKYWMTRYKAVGFESLQLRQAGQAARLEETTQRIHELLDKKVNNIPELEVPQNIKCIRGSEYNDIKTAGL